MEKSVKEVFNEIQTTIEELRAQLDELEEKLEALEEEVAEPEPEPIEVEPEPVDVDLPSEETDPFVAETPRDDIPVIPSEVADEAKESETENSDELEALSAEGGISRRAEKEEQGDDWKAPAESEAEAACPSGQLRSSGGDKSESRSDDEDRAIDLSIDMSSIGAKTVPDAKNYQWMIDLPGGPVANVISAISLNDRVLFINTLFKEDPALFQNTISEFNKMESISEAVSYVIANFPDWNLNSEVVYRLMMAVRRKLK